MDGNAGETRLGNTTLVEYGIRQEESDYRIHVCPESRRVYVYETAAGLEAIKRGHGQMREVRTGGIITARGYAMPVEAIPGILSYRLPEDLEEKYYIEKHDPTGKKGIKASKIAKAMIDRGDIKLVRSTEEINVKSIQLSGTDLTVNSALNIQVKCDYRGGEKRFGGTGNLFLQVSECNPFRQF